MINGEGALAILGGGGGFGGGSGVSALTSFRLYQKDQVGQRKAFASQPSVQRQIDNFKRDIKKIDTSEELLENRRVLEFVLTSFGLESEINNVGKLRAVLNSDVDDINSFANRLNDPRFGQLATFLGGEAFGTQNLKTSDKQGVVIDQYLTNRFEQSLAAQNPAVRDALFFLRRINEVGSTFDILGDLALRNIVTDTLDLPKEIARQSVTKQAALIDKGLNLETLQGSKSSQLGSSSLSNFKADQTALSQGAKQINGALAQINALVTQLDTLRASYANIPNLIDPAGVNASEIPIQEAAIPELLRQRGLVSAAELAIDTGDASLKRLNTILNSLKSAEDQEAFDTLQTEFLKLSGDLLADDGVINGATFTDPNTGLTQNLLRNGSAGALPPGTDATAAKITTAIATDGSKAVTNTTDLAGFLADLQTVRDGIATATFATAAADTAAVRSTLETAAATFKTARSLVQIAGSSLRYSVDQIDFSAELDSAGLALGKSSLDDSISRAGTIDTLLVDLAGISRRADQPGADLADLNEQYTLKLSELNKAFDTPRSVTDGTTTITLDNLLTDGSVDYNVIGGNLARAEGFDLDATIRDNLPTTLDGTNGDALADTLIDTYRPQVQDAIAALKRDRGVLGFASDRLDPRGRLDAQIREIAAKLNATIEKAKVDDVNLLSEFGSDAKITLQSNGATLTIDAQNDFASTFGAAIESVEFTILSGGGDAARIGVINDALFAAGRTQGLLNAEKYALDIQKGIADENVRLLEGDQAESTFFKEIEYTPEALKFIERYLTQKDLEAQGFGGTNYNPDSALIGLFQPLNAGTNLLV